MPAPRGPPPRAGSALAEGRQPARRRRPRVSISPRKTPLLTGGAPDIRLEAEPQEGTTTSAPADTALRGLGHRCQPPVGTSKGPAVPLGSGRPEQKPETAELREPQGAGRRGWAAVGSKGRPATLYTCLSFAISPLHRWAQGGPVLPQRPVAELGANGSWLRLGRGPPPLEHRALPQNSRATSHELAWSPLPQTAVPDFP